MCSTITAGVACVTRVIASLSPSQAICRTQASAFEQLFVLDFRREIKEDINRKEGVWADRGGLEVRSISFGPGIIYVEELVVRNRICNIDYKMSEAEKRTDRSIRDHGGVTRVAT